MVAKMNRKSLALAGIVIFIAAAALAFSGSLLATVLVAGFLDGIHPCGIGVLLFFAAFLLSIRKARRDILLAGGVYIAGVFLAYLLIGLGIMKAATFFPPMFMGQLSAALLVALGLLTAHDALAGTQTLKLPSFSRPWIQDLIQKATLPGALAAGVVVGLCAFPCAGGIYVAIIGLLASRVDFASSLAYLFIYNLAFVLPLVFLLLASTNQRVVEKLENAERANRKAYKLVFAAVLLALAAAVYLGTLG